MRTNSQATHLAKQIQAKLGALIAAVCLNTIVHQSFLAGLISVENAKLDASASRFEAHVFKRLKAVRNSLIFWRRSYNGITQAQLAGMSDDALKNLATSWGYTQIMGYHIINNLRKADGSAPTIAELRDHHLHLSFAVQLLEKVAMRYMAAGNWPAVLRIWNSGSPNGKTHDPNYVDNALAVRRAY